MTNLTSRDLQKTYLVRHGETAWSNSGRHTGRTDVPLTEQGERDAQGLRARLRDVTVAHVLTSPLQRAHMHKIPSSSKPAMAARTLFQAYR